MLLGSAGQTDRFLLLAPRDTPCWGTRGRIDDRSLPFCRVARRLLFRALERQERYIGYTVLAMLLTTCAASTRPDTSTGWS